MPLASKAAALVLALANACNGPSVPDPAPSPSPSPAAEFFLRRENGSYRTTCRPAWF